MKTMFLISMMMVLTATERPTVQDSRPVILAFGDSLTAGYGVPRGSGYPELLQRKLDALGYKYRIVNMGISGDTTSGGRPRLHGALNGMPSIILLELGAKDGLRGMPTTQMQGNLEEMSTAFQKTRRKQSIAARARPRN